MTIKVLLADDNELMRSAIRRTLQEEPRIEVVGEASSFAKAVQMIAESKPDVVLLDLHLAEKRKLSTWLREISTYFCGLHFGCVLFQ